MALLEQYIDIGEGAGDVVLETHQMVVDEDRIDDNEGRQHDQGDQHGVHGRLPASSSCRDYTSAEAAL